MSRCDFGTLWRVPGPVPPCLAPRPPLQPSPAVVSELHLCYPVRTFRPKLEPGLVGECPDVHRGCLGHTDVQQLWALGLGLPLCGFSSLYHLI